MAALSSARARAAILACAAAAAGCGGSETRLAGSAADALPDSLRRGGVAVVGFLAEAQSMNEFASADAGSDELQSHVLFTTLIRYDERLRPVPYLAAGWDTAAAGDGLALTFRMRRDVTWHDGTPTTARDVEFTFDRMKDPATAYPNASAFELYDSAVVRDSFSITFYLRRHVDYLDVWRTVSPMPRHILGDVAPERLGRHPFGTERPVGNGPFRFVEHRSGDRWIFEANPAFPEGLGGRPYLDRLIYRVIEEPTTRLAELLGGTLDIYLTVVPDHVGQIEASRTARVVSYPSRTYVFIAWNGRHPLFRDPRVRRALAHAIDRRRIVDAVRAGLGEVAAGPVPPFHWAHDPELEPLEFDPDRARTLLREAGWEDADGDGVRERAGVPASFELKTNPNRVREAIMTLVQADLARVGVRVRQRLQEPQSLLSDITTPERRFDAIVLGWESSFRLDDRDLFACSRLDAPFQFASYCNPRVDSLFDRLARIESRDAARPLWREYQRIIREDQPFTFIYHEVVANGVNRRLRDVDMDIRGTLTGAGDWWIAPGDRRATAARRER